MTGICVCAVFAIQGSCEDPGEPDTVRFGEWTVDLTGPPPYHGPAIVPLVVFNDEELFRMDLGFTWTGPIVGDSGKFVDERAQYLTNGGVQFNNDERILYVWASAPEPCMPGGDGDFMHLYFTIVDTGVVFIDSTCMPWAEFLLYDCSPEINRITPQFESPEYYIEPPPPLSGDVNGDWVVNVGDVVALVNYLYKGGPPPKSLNQADVNGDCLVDVGDVVYLVNYLYKSGPAPVQGCVE
jgi:hypothetical protein